jgi:hypothetical protein
MTPLVPHPTTPETAFGVAAGVERVGGALRFAYRVVGALDAVRWPAWTTPGRVDGLWEHTCFEAFVAVDGEDGYTELNVAPSGEWAVYRFARHRDRAATQPTFAPEVAASRSADAVDVEATLPGDPRQLRVGLTAVVERTDGRKSYWALRHPAAKPDFHDARGFVLRLAAA